MNRETTEELMAPFVGIVGQCFRLNEDILKPDFDGFTRLDPTLNKAVCLIHAADEAVACFPQGGFPLTIAWLAVKESLRLLRRCRMRYGRERTKAMEQAYHIHFRLWFYQGAPTHPAELFRKKLFESEARLVDAICDHNAHIVEAAGATDGAGRVLVALDAVTGEGAKALRRAVRPVGRPPKAAQKMKALSKVQVGVIFGESDDAVYNWETGRTPPPQTADGKLVYCKQLREEGDIAALQKIAADHKKRKRIGAYIDAKHRQRLVEEQAARDSSVVAEAIRGMRQGNTPVDDRL